MEHRLIGRSSLPPRSLSAVIPSRSSAYEVRLAAEEGDVIAALELRYEVFNVELGEGLATSRLTGLDRDPFDEAMLHLLAIESRTGRVVGTYRMQTGRMAKNQIGFYSAQEFDLHPFESVHTEVLELGRACIHRDHRKASVVLLLWRAIAEIAHGAGCRYLIGCSSLTSQDPAVGRSAWLDLARNHLVAPATFQVEPRPEYRLPHAPPRPAPVKIPKLLRAYLGVGAKVCGPPAMDRAFGTIDFLTMLDLRRTNPTASGHFLKSLEG
jgi:putative hemolysin